MLRGLRILLVIDAAVLIVLGVLFVLAPGQVARSFHFTDLPEGVHYIIGLWGCALGTMALGYVAAALDPLRHRVWVQAGIARGALECVLGLLYVARGVVTFRQASFGILVAGLLAAGYVILYPREAALAPKPEEGTT